MGFCPLPVDCARLARFTVTRIYYLPSNMVEVDVFVSLVGADKLIGGRWVQPRKSFRKLKEYA
jgi:hypothetical protein